MVSAFINNTLEKKLSDAFINLRGKYFLTYNSPEAKLILKA